MKKEIYFSRWDIADEQNQEETMMKFHEASRAACRFLFLQNDKKQDISLQKSLLFKRKYSDIS